MKPAVFVEMLTLELGMCGGLWAQGVRSSYFFLVAWERGSRRRGLLWAWCRASFRSGQLSHLGRSISGHGTEESQTCLGAGWLGSRGIAVWSDSGKRGLGQRCQLRSPGSFWAGRGNDGVWSLVSREFWGRGGDWAQVQQLLKERWGEVVGAVRECLFCLGLLCFGT